MCMKYYCLVKLFLLFFSESFPTWKTNTKVPRNLCFMAKPKVSGMLKSCYIELSISSPYGVWGWGRNGIEFSIIIIFHGSAWADLSYLSWNCVEVPGNILASGVFWLVRAELLAKVLNGLLTILKQENKIVGYFGKIWDELVQGIDEPWENVNKSDYFRFWLDLKGL